MQVLGVHIGIDLHNKIIACKRKRCRTLEEVKTL